MRKIFGIARYTFIEIFRNKVWYVLILFSAILDRLDAPSGISGRRAERTG